MVMITKKDAKEYLEKTKRILDRGNASLSDNLKYINDTVSHLEINRFQGVGDIMYQVVAKALTINVVTGKKAFVVWAVQEIKIWKQQYKKQKMNYAIASLWAHQFYNSQALSKMLEI